jgi:hypothetical protein
MLHNAPFLKGARELGVVVLVWTRTSRRSLLATMLCGAAVCRAHDRLGEFYDALWLTRLGAPRFYPDVVTLVVATAVEAFPGQPLVAYERGHELAAAHQAGFETIGHLRIWSLRAGAR